MEQVDGADITASWTGHTYFGDLQAVVGVGTWVVVGGET